jgi:hypothetical protein
VLFFFRMLGQTHSHVLNMSSPQPKWPASISSPLPPAYRGRDSASDLVVILRSTESDHKKTFDSFLQALGPRLDWHILYRVESDYLQVLIHIEPRENVHIQDHSVVFAAPCIDIRSIFATTPPPNFVVSVTGVSRKEMDRLWLQVVGESGWLYHPMWYYHQYYDSWVSTSERSFSWCETPAS